MKTTAEKVLEVIADFFLFIFWIIVMGCPFLCYPSMAQKLLDPNVSAGTVILMPLIMGFMMYNMFNAFNFIKGIGKKKPDTYDVQLITDSKMNLIGIKMLKNGKIYSYKSVDEIAKETVHEESVQAGQTNSSASKETTV